jgi:MinD-like ATPase involved in chromosome partitioning or flagellar assembly
LIDIDPQGSLADWWNEREAEYPAFAQTTVSRLANDLQVLRQQGFKLAVIDTPPAITMAIQSVISVAELIVVPTRPSPHDLRAVGATVDLCERAGKPLVFDVVGGAIARAGGVRVSDSTQQYIRVTLARPVPDSGCEARVLIDNAKSCTSCSSRKRTPSICITTTPKTGRALRHT